MSTPAKLVPEGSFGGPAAVPPSTADNDASEAVAAVLTETGADRAEIEGPDNSVVLPEGTQTGTQTGTPPRDATTGKFTKPGEGAAASSATTAAPAAPATTPAAPAAATPSSPAPAEQDLNLDAETLAVIEKNPEMRRAYKVMQRGLTKKFSELAADRKAHEADLTILTALRQNPEAGLRALAATLGVQVPAAGGSGGSGGSGSSTTTPAGGPGGSPQPKTPLDVAEEALAKIFPKEGASALAPALVEIAKAVAAGELQPLRTELQQNRQELLGHRQAQVVAGLTTELTNYGRAVEARGDDWTDDIQVEMSKLVGQVAPGRRPDGTPVSVPEYLDILYHHVTGVRAHESVKQRQLARLRAAAATAEPAPVRTTGAPRATDQRITPEMSNADADALAVQQTLEELGFGGR